jgi:hypothetical protein
MDTSTFKPSRGMKQPLQTVLFVCFDCESVVELPARGVGFVNLLVSL